MWMRKKAKKKMKRKKRMRGWNDFGLVEVPGIRCVIKQGYVLKDPFSQEKENDQRCAQKKSLQATMKMSWKWERASEESV